MTRIRSGAPLLAVALIVIAVLAGCGSGRNAQTSREVAAISGANSGTGPVVIRDAQIVGGSDVNGAAIYQPGGTAPLQLWTSSTWSSRIEWKVRRRHRQSRTRRAGGGRRRGPAGR